MYARSLGNTDDDAGHIIGKQLGGSGGKKNVFLQNFHVNRGAFAQFEGKVADFIELHGETKVKLTFKYDQQISKTRPISVTYDVIATNGVRMKSKRFDNSH